MVRYSIKWSLNAKQNLKSIHDYIANNRSKEEANYVVQHLRRIVKDAAVCPTKYPRIGEDSTIRFAVKWKYKIIFQINIDYISILKIFHTAQHPDKALIDIDL